LASKPRRHMVIPDVQIRDGVDDSHLEWIGQYIAEKRPEQIVCIGDFADMPSLNYYSVGKAPAEGKRYANDIAATRRAMDKLTRPFRKLKGYRPDMDLTLGNHEHRITREAEQNPKFIGTISVKDLGYEEFGWKVHPFLQPVIIDGVAYAHYFVSGVLGRPVGSAAALLRARHASATMGHVQVVDMAIHPQTQQTALMCGICYLHDEDYLTPQGQNTRRQIVMKHEVRDGKYDPMFVSLDFLRRRYS
jgi:hypothetical protein